MAIRRHDRSLLRRRLPAGGARPVASRPWTGYSVPFPVAKSDRLARASSLGLIAGGGAELRYFPATVTSANGAWLPWRRLRP
jgi:hypothetical protein